MVRNISDRVDNELQLTEDQYKYIFGGLYTHRKCCFFTQTKMLDDKSRDKYVF